MFILIEGRLSHTTQPFTKMLICIKEIKQVKKLCTGNLRITFYDECVLDLDVTNMDMSDMCKEVNAECL